MKCNSCTNSSFFTLAGFIITRPEFIANGSLARTDEIGLAFSRLPR